MCTLNVFQQFKISISQIKSFRFWDWKIYIERKYLVA